MRDEKRPIIAGAKRRRGAKGKGQVRDEVRAAARVRVLEILMVQLRASLPDGCMEELISMYLMPTIGGPGVASLLGGMFRGAFGGSRMPKMLNYIRTGLVL